MLKQKDKLTKYDIDRANAMYDLTLKQIALEEAQQTANKMKLTRDAEGNYSYQYIQDKDAIAEAEAALAEANNNLYNLDKDRKAEMINEFFSMWEEYQSKMSEAMATGDKALQQRVWEHYFGAEGMLAMLQAQLGIVLDSSEALAAVFEGDQKFSEIITRIDIDADSTLAQIFSSTSSALQTLSETMGGTFGAEGALTKVLTEISDSLDPESLSQDWFGSTTDNESIIGQMSNLSSNLSDYMKSVSAHAKSITDAVTKFVGNGENDDTAALWKNTAALNLLATEAGRLIEILAPEEREFGGSGSLHRPDVDHNPSQIKEIMK